LKSLNVEYRLFDTNPLVHPDNMPYSIDELPDVYTPFRKRVEGLNDRLAKPCYPIPEHFKPVPSIPETEDHGADLDKIPEADIVKYLLKPLEGSQQSVQNRQSKKSAFPFAGGETSALDRLQWYFIKGSGCEAPPASTYKQTRNRMLGHEYSTKMSPFLALGSVSPRMIVEKLNRHEEQYGSSKDTYWIQFELLWRDYFMYITRKYGSKLFTIGGFEQSTDPKSAQSKINDWKPFDSSDPVLMSWVNGNTGVPFIDANMQELIQSGFMSNRGRQNVASFLAKDLYYDWRIGAEYFESQLIDFEPCANYGNWQYHAGCGNDPRASRQFNPIKQGKDYDVHGAYIKHWLPQLNKVPSSRVHTPWLLSAEERTQFGLDENKYPSKPVIEQPSWKSHYNRKEGQRSKGNGNKNENNTRKGATRSGPKKNGLKKAAKGPEDAVKQDSHLEEDEEVGRK